MCECVAEDKAARFPTWIPKANRTFWNEDTSCRQYLLFCFLQLRRHWQAQCVHSSGFQVVTCVSES